MSLLVIASELKSFFFDIARDDTHLDSLAQACADALCIALDCEQVARSYDVALGPVVIVDDYTRERIALSSLDDEALYDRVSEALYDAIESVTV